MFQKSPSCVLFTAARLPVRLLQSLILSFGLSLVSGAIADEPELRAGAQVLSPIVHNLDSRRGVAAVYQRVQAIAENNCVSQVDGASALTTAERQCRDEVLARLLGKLADPYLSYLHANPEELLVAKR